MFNNTTSNASFDPFDIVSGEFRKYQLVPLSIIFGIGFIANSMVIFNGIRRRKVIKHFSNYFVLSMAVADWCVVFFTIPATFFEYLVGFHNMDNYICTYILTIRETFQGAAIFSITTLAILRVRQVMTNPLKQFSKRVCRRLVAAIWIISFLICTTPFYRVYEIDREIGVCDPNYASPLRAKVHLTFVTCILISPMLIATISYGIVIVKVTNLLNGSDPDSERLTNRNRNIAMLLIMLILSCWISYTPLGIYLLVDVYSEIVIDLVIWQVVTILYFGGSALNPILVLLTMRKDYHWNIECTRDRRVGVQEMNVEQKVLKSSNFPLEDQNMSQGSP